MLVASVWLTTLFVVRLFSCVRLQTARSRDEFTLFMTELESATPAAANAAAIAGRRDSNGAAASERFRAASGKLNNVAAPASPDLKPAAAPVAPRPDQLNPSPEAHDRDEIGDRSVVDEEKKDLKAMNGFAAASPASSSPQSFDGMLVEEVSESHPDFAVMRPLSASTLELQFPQLASFDLYLHSEIE